MIMQEIRGRISKLRKEWDMRQLVFADKIGVSYQEANGRVRSLTMQELSNLYDNSYHFGERITR